MTDIQMYLVGGAVRDDLLGVKSKDLDYSVVVDPALDLTIAEAFTFMRDHLNDLGFKIFLETEQFLTIRAQFPLGHENEKQTADFVLARQEGPYTDGRRPDWVKPGTLHDDLSRRDFTVNAMARAEDGSLIDPFNGLDDLINQNLRAVGNARNRLKEDALRAMRAIRFAVTKDFAIDPDLAFAMRTVAVQTALVENIAAERIKDELHKCFAFNSVETIVFLMHNFPTYLDIIQQKGIWLEPTMKAAK